jgi:hypothetical protein
MDGIPREKGVQDLAGANYIAEGLSTGWPQQYQRKQAAAPW